MRLPRSEHTSQPWRIHEIAHDFRVEDVWALPTPGGPDDFPHLVRLIAAMDPSQSKARASRLLFEIRWKLGELFGWDEDGGNAPTLRDRLPANLRDQELGAEFDALPFAPLYVTDDELAAEVANRTVHGVLHVGWVPDEEAGGYRGQLAILVKRNGLLGAAYMAAITPFRYLVVYPQMLGEIGRAWSSTTGPHARR